MKICVVGWYYYESFYTFLEMVAGRFPVTIVAHQKNFISPLPTVEKPNVGLEWGAYNHYLMNVWDGKDEVLFTHDDVDLKSSKPFDEVACIKGYDCVFIFRRTQDVRMDLGGHGRCLKMSPRLMDFLRNHKCRCNYWKRTSGGNFHTGLYYDESNTGKVEREQYDGKLEVNAGIQHLMFVLKELEKDKSKKWKFGSVTVPSYNYGFRGLVGIKGILKECNHIISASSRGN
jgi:hypothetical protein